jgi:hypothetical protein
VQCAVSQSLCSIVLGATICPEVRFTVHALILDADSIRGVPSGRSNK